MSKNRVRSLAVWVFVFSLIGIFSHAQQQQTLSAGAQLNLTGEIVALASCANGSTLVAASASEGATLLQRIDTATKKLAGSAVRVSVADPSALALSRDCGTAYIADKSAGKVYVAALANGQLRAEIAVGKSPIALARAAHNADLYAVNQGDGTVSVIDTQLNQLKATVRVGNTPTGIALYSNGAHNRAFVTNTGSNNISIIDINDDPNNLNRYRVIFTVATGPQPTAIATIVPTPVGSWLGDMFAYFINSGDNTLSRIWITVPHAVDSVVPLGETALAVALDPVRSCAYAVTGSGTQSTLAVAVAKFFATPNPTVPVGQDLYHELNKYTLSERLSAVSHFIPLIVSERVPGNPEPVFRIERQLWMVTKPNQLNLYVLDGKCPQLRGDEP
ncbi:MAG: YncE family protein [Candidatus Bipolaricaulota bacterium]|nr:YncE family protein [Candidatus Bipolaricaulota bacterium]